MIRRKHHPVRETKFERSGELILGSRTILFGEVFKVVGEHGTKFKFAGLVTNKETGAQWVDCFEISKGEVSMWRSFKTDRIKAIPKKRGKGSVS
jgi:hypothetical protein